FEGQGKSRVPVGMPTPEEPTRLVGQLQRLARCSIALGLSELDACELAVRVAFDSVPLGRMRALRTVARAAPGATVADVLRGIGRGNRWAAQWELDSLEAIGLVVDEGPDRNEEPSAPHVYRLADQWEGVYESVASSRTPLSQQEDSQRGGLQIRT